MKLHTLWAWLPNEEGPSLLEAWDEYDVEQNDAGWREACSEALKRADAKNFRYIDISVPYDPIEAAFYPAEVEATDVSDASHVSGKDSTP